MIVTVYRYGDEPLNGYWFSFLRSQENSRMYHINDNKIADVGGNRIYEYQITLANPLIFNPHTCFTPVFPMKLYEKYIDVKYGDIVEYYLRRKESEYALARVLRLLGYDSVIFENSNCYYEGINQNNANNDNKHNKYNKYKNENGYIDLWLLRNIHTYRHYVREITYD